MGPESRKDRETGPGTEEEGAFTCQHRSIAGGLGHAWSGLVCERGSNMSIRRARNATIRRTLASRSHHMHHTPTLLKHKRAIVDSIQEDPSGEDSGLVSLYI